MEIRMINRFLSKTSLWWVGAVLIALLCTAHSVYAQSPNEPSDIYFYDSQFSIGEVGGFINFIPAADQSSITDYAVYFTDEQGKKLKKIGNVNVKATEERIANAKKTGMFFNRRYYEIEVKDSPLPSGAKKVGVFTMNGSIESDVGVFRYFLDSPDAYIAKVDFIDTNPQLRQIEGTLRWEETAGHPEVEGYLISYEDGLGKLHAISGLSEQYKSGKGKYEVPIPLGTLPSSAATIRIQVALKGEEGYFTQTYQAKVIDNISGDTKGIEVTTKGLPEPKELRFIDSDKTYGTIAGEINWNSHDESFLKQSSSKELGSIYYSLYFLDADDRKIKGILAVPANLDTYGYYRSNIPEGTVVPPDARSIGVFVQLQSAEGVAISKLELRDSNGKDHYAKNVRFVDEDPKEDSIHGIMKWSASDGEEDLKGYALFSGEEEIPFMIVKKAGPDYEAKVPDSIIAAKPSGIRIMPVAANGQFLHSNDPSKEGNFLIADSYETKTNIVPGTMGDYYNSNDSFSFIDEDKRPNLIGGVVQILLKAQTNEGRREIYFYDRKGQRIASIGKVYFNSSKAGDKVTFMVPLGTPIPKGAVFIGSSISENGAITNEYGTRFSDNSDSVKVKFSDIDRIKDSNRVIILSLTRRGIITGFQDGTFRPEASVTRAQFTSMIMRSFRMDTEEYKGTFKDVSVDDWYSGIIATGVSSGLLTGYEDGTVRPDQVITRKEMYAIVYRILEWRHQFDGIVKKGDGSEYVRHKYTDGETIPDWLFNAVYVLNYYKLTPEDKTIDLDKQVSRAECATMIYNLMNMIY
jgi:hypothetical protein